MLELLHGDRSAHLPRPFGGPERCGGFDTRQLSSNVRCTDGWRRSQSATLKYEEIREDSFGDLFDCRIRAGRLWNQRSGGVVLLHVGGHVIEFFQRGHAVQFKRVARRIAVSE